MPKFIKRYKVDFFYQRGTRSKPIWIVCDGHPLFRATPASAVIVCRIDMEMGTTESLDETWEKRAIGVAATSMEDAYNKSYGRQVALLRAAHYPMLKDARALILENWFREHGAVKGAKAGDMHKFLRLVDLVEWSERAKAWMSEPLFYEGPEKESTKSA